MWANEKSEKKVKDLRYNNFIWFSCMEKGNHVQQQTQSKIVGERERARERKKFRRTNMTFITVCTRRDNKIIKCTANIHLETARDDEIKKVAKNEKEQRLKNLHTSRNEVNLVYLLCETL